MYRLYDIRSLVIVVTIPRPFHKQLSVCRQFCYPLEVSSMKYCCLGVFRKEYCRLNSANRKKNIKAHIPPKTGFASGRVCITQCMKCTCPTQRPNARTQCHLYSTGWRRGLASGLTQILGLASGVWRRETQIFTF